MPKMVRHREKIHLTDPNSNKIILSIIDRKRRGRIFVVPTRLYIFLPGR
jgi:hypothetical protein